LIVLTPSLIDKYVLFEALCACERGGHTKEASLL